jgi:hypothetical protein
VRISEVSCGNRAGFLISVVAFMFLRLAAVAGIVVMAPRGVRLVL